MSQNKDEEFFENIESLGMKFFHKLGVIISNLAKKHS